MQPKRLIIAALLLAGLGGALWWSNKEEANKDKKPSPDDAPKVLEVPQDQISKLEIRRMGAEPVVLARSGDSWTIQSPQQLPADSTAVSGLVGTLSSLPSERLVEEKVADFKPYGLQEPILTIVVSRKDGKSSTLHIGDDVPAGGASFARIDGDSRLFTLASSNKASLEKTWRDLRDKRLLPFDSEKLTRVELAAKGPAIEFGKNNANSWTILKPRALRADNFAAEELVRKLKDARMEVTNDTEEESTWPKRFAAATAVATAKVTDQKGTMQLEVRQDKDKTYFARSSAVNGIFKTTPELGEGLAKSLDDFRNKKLFDFGFNEPKSVEVRQEGKVYTFTKSGNDWKRDGKTYDSGSVQQIVDRLRDLTATRFADAAAGAVVAEYTVDKEKVTVAKQGDTFLAKRGSEPEVYVLDAKAVNELKDLAAAAKEAPQPPAKK